jgi:uncharacterized protein YqjF (DUF2071 family)
VRRTARELQLAIEKRRIQGPQAFDALERDSAAFLKFAYATHPVAYVDAGLAALPLHDVLLVLATPDVHDLLTEDGLLQVVRTAIDLAKQHDQERDPKHHARVRQALPGARRSLRRLQLNGGQPLADEARNLILALDQLRELDVPGMGVLAELRGAFDIDLNMRQKWETVLLCSWRLQPDQLRRLVPKPLELDVDVEDGHAWVSLVPLKMAEVGPERPRLFSLDTFPQVNFRTYVRYGGRSGVYFFSLECQKLLVRLAAKLLFHLPYHGAKVAIDRTEGKLHCRTDGRGPHGAAILDCRYRPKDEPALAEQGSLDEFLAERYSMFVVEDGRVLRGDVEHAPWKLQPAEIEVNENTLVQAYGLPRLGAPDHVRFSPGVETRTLPFVDVT